MAFTEGKKIKGRNRHIVVDTQGHLLYAEVHAANRHDTKAGCSVLGTVAKLYPSIQGFSADGGYQGTCVRYVEGVLHKTIEISHKIKDQFAILPKRWVVERTFGWFNLFRRLAKDYEILAASEKNFLYIASMRLTLANLG